MTRAVYRAPEFDAEPRRPVRPSSRGPVVEHRKAASTRPPTAPSAAAAPQPKAGTEKLKKAEQIKLRMNAVREQIVSQVREILATIGNEEAIALGEKMIAERELDAPFTGKPPKPGKPVRVTCYLTQGSYQRVNELAREQKRAHSDVVSDLVLKALDERT